LLVIPPPPALSSSFVSTLQAFVQQFADAIMGFLDDQLSTAYSAFLEYVAEGAPLLEIVDTVVQVLDWFPSMSSVVSGIRTAVETVQRVSAFFSLRTVRPPCVTQMTPVCVCFHHGGPYPQVLHVAVLELIPGD
jgi:hypothetical protein